MSLYGVTIRDALGTLGSNSASRLARIVYDGVLEPFQTAYIPDFDANAGIWFRYQDGRPILGGTAIFNNVTKILTNDGGVSVQYFFFSFAGPQIYVPGSYGLSIKNSNNEIIIDNRSRNAEIVSQGTVSIPFGHAVQTVTYPEVDYPQVFVTMPFDSYMYIGRPTSTTVGFSAEAALTFNYFVTGFRRNALGLSAGHHLTFRDDSGRVVFHSARPYARIAGSYFVPPYENLNANGNPLTDFAWQMKQAPTDAYVMFTSCFQIPKGGGEAYSYAVKRGQIIGDRDYFRSFRFTMNQGVANAIGLQANPNSASSYFKQFLMLGTPH